MQKSFKKILCTLLVVVMCLTSAPLEGFVDMQWPEFNLPEFGFNKWFSSKASAATLAESGSCGENVTYTYNSSTGEVVISGTGPMTDNSPFEGSLFIRSVIIESGVTSIGYQAFFDCFWLESITIPDSVTSIGYGAFNYCPSLESVHVTDIASWCNIAFGDVASNPFNYCAGNLYLNGERVAYLKIPDSVTSIGDYAFYGCSSLTSITIPDSVTSIGDYAFDTCTRLASITIGNGVTSIGDGAFYGCTSLKSVIIPDSVTSIGDYAFGNCTSLASITIPDSVTSMGVRPFNGTAYCKNESNWENDVLYIGNHIIAAKTSISGDYEIKEGTRCIAGYAFYDCESLTSITIPDSVTSIGPQAFRYCTRLTSVTIPDSVTSIGDHAFYSCSSLTSITIPDSVTSIGGYAFYYCTRLASIIIPDSVTSIGYCAFYHCTRLTSITIGNGVTSIGSEAFYDCYNLISVTIGNGVTSIGDDAFKGCDNLTSVYITDIASWCNIDFYGFFSNPLYCAENLYLDGELVTDLIIPDGVTSISEFAFYDCESLTSVTIPDSVTSIGDFAFESCSSLASVAIGNSVTSIGSDAFSYCNSLTSVKIGNSVTSIGGSAFYSCSSLTNITIPDSVTSIGHYAFSNCSSLTSITVYENNQYYSNNEDGILFNKDKTTLVLYPLGITRTSYTIPDSVTSIDYGAFYGCSSLTSITIPDSVTSIGDYAFASCKNLTILCCKDSVVETYAKDNHIDYMYGGYLSNGLYWELDEIKLDISGDATAIPGFAPGQAPWANLVEEVRVINVDVENLKKIGQYAFFGLSEITSIILDTKNPLSIGKYAFWNIGSHRQIHFDGSSKTWKSFSVDYGNDDLKQAYVICLADGITIEPEHIPEKSDGLILQNFVQEHVEIAENALTPEILKTASFDQNAAVDNTVLTALNLWQAIGDLGKVFAFQLDGYSFNANYYDVYLSELILLLNNEQKTSSLECKINDIYNNSYNDVMAVLKTSEEWEKDLESTFIDDIEMLFKGETYEIPEGVRLFLDKHLTHLLENNKEGLTKIFKGLDSASNLIDNISDAADVVNMFIEAYNVYVVSKALFEVNSDFFTVLLEANSMMGGGTNGSYNRMVQFRDSINKAKDTQLGSQQAMFDAMYSVAEDSTLFLYEKLVQDTVKAVIYPAVAELLGCAAGNVLAVSFAYNTTFKIVDAVSKLGKKAELYNIMNCILPIERVLQTVVEGRRSKLLRYESESDALKYDMAYNILRQTNIFLYDTAYKYGATVNNKQEMNFATMFKNNWSRWKCHYGNYGSGYNLFSAHCPVDVYIYDANGLLVTSVVNEEIVVYSDEITVSLFNGEKTFAYPIEKDYTVKIVAREEGTMDYSSGVITDTDLEFEVKSYNIPLQEQQEFTVNMPTSQEEATEEDYKLETNDTLVELDYNSYEACEEHIFGEWTDGAETKERKCDTCGYIEYMTVCDHSQYETVMSYFVEPTCQKAGHTIYVCSGCGEQVSDGEDLDAVQCNYLAEDFEAICTEKAYTKYTCVYCGDFYYEGITAEELNASAHDYTETVVDATCISGGYTEYICEVCEHTYIDSKTEVNKDAHKEEFTSVTEPTCTENGYTTYTCTLCGNTSNRDETQASGHSYKSVVTKPTCTTGGYTTYTCSNCTDIYVADATEASGHNYKSVVTQPTCTKDGYTTYTCESCDDSYVADEVTAKGHSYKCIVTKPTCTKDGYTTYTCESCGNSYVADKVTANGHSYKDVITKPTCTKDGYTTYTCDTCNDTYISNKTSATGHKYTANSIDNGCLEDSYVIYTCSCGDTYSETIRATGHDFDGSKCKNCDYDKSDECSCNCHKTGFMSFIWKILRFFYKLFGMNKVCDCGVAHY